MADSASPGDPGEAKKEDPLSAVKSALDAQMRQQPYRRFGQEYEAGEFADCRFAELVTWGRDQTFTGLTHQTPKGQHTPHGWGILEHHEGFVQANAMWRDGVPDGLGMWAMAGQGQCGYGTWVDGKRDGYFALVKEGGVYIEEYAQGELKRRIKWRKDKLHVTCTRCNMLFVPSANTSEEKFCRFHLSKPDYDGRYPCCGALREVNPRGCSTSMHVGPDESTEPQ
eukprot:TRINITY_DN44331_c0_g1_i1.p1 TRINITY_DN44331_c0_g1~~TRINITY_DN44331_c0_g1_i1.p1  ORF type:complete len:225 (+),score=28.20 TRINITY_DN44331_c0_g1_i1:156-830(+)